MYTCLPPGRTAGVFLGCSCENTMGFLEAKPMMYRGPLESLTLVQSTLGLQHLVKQKCQYSSKFLAPVSISQLGLFGIFCLPRFGGGGSLP